MDEVMAGIPVPDDMIVISKKEYQELVADSEFLQNLRDAGVDNWDGYHHGWSGWEDDCE